MIGAPIVANATLPGVARTPDLDEKPQICQNVPIWMAAKDIAMWRSKKDLERHGKKRPEGCAGS